MSSGASYVASTPNAQNIYTVEIARIEPSEIEGCVDKTKFDSLCESGCSNYQKKWSCPPYAPCFSEYCIGWDFLFVFFMHTNMSQYSHIMNDYLKIKAANSILKSRADKFLRRASAMHGRYISTGSCRLCRPCKCSVAMPCARSELMAYSFEAMGVDVSSMTELCFNTPLLWYKAHRLPEYTSVICGLLTNKIQVTTNSLQAEYAAIITS